MTIQRCEFTPPGEPTGPGVGEGDRRAWRDRHQCREIATHSVEPLVSDRRHMSCATHLHALVDTGARVLNLEAFETKNRAREQSASVVIHHVEAKDPDRWLMDFSAMVARR